MLLKLVKDVELIIVPISTNMALLYCSCVLTHYLKRTVESNTNDLNKKYYYYFVTKCVTSM